MVLRQLDVFLPLGHAEAGADAGLKHACYDYFTPVEGGSIPQSGLARHLPGDFEKTLSALFTYRNKMFHHGLEWPKAERDKFQDKIRDGHWPADWFSKATSTDPPWVFYMSQTSILHCLATADKLLASFGLLVKELREQSNQDRRDAT